MGTHKNRIVISTHNILFYGEIWKIIPELSSNTHLICSSVTSTNLVVTAVLYGTDSNPSRTTSHVRKPCSACEWSGGFLGDLLLSSHLLDCLGSEWVRRPLGMSGSKSLVISLMWVRSLARVIFETRQVLFVGGQEVFLGNLPFLPHLTIDSAENEWNNLDKTQIVVSVLALQPKGRWFDPPLLLSYGWDYKPRSRLCEGTFNSAHHNHHHHNQIKKELVFLYILVI